MSRFVTIALLTIALNACGGGDDEGPEGGAGGAGGAAGSVTAGSGGANAGSGGATAGGGHAGVPSAGGTSGATAGAGGSPMPVAGMGSTECADGAVLCAGQCVSADLPQAGGCRFLGQHGDNASIFEDGDGFYLAGNRIVRISFADGSAQTFTSQSGHVFDVVADADFVYYVGDMHSSATLGQIVYALKRIPRAGGSAELLVDDLSEFHTLGLHAGELLVGASQGGGEEGLLRFSTDGAALGVLVPEPTLAFSFVDDRLVYLEYDFGSGHPKVAPASGGAGEPLLEAYTASRIGGVHEGVGYFVDENAIHASDLTTHEETLWLTEEHFDVIATQPGVLYWFDARAGVLKRVMLGGTPVVETLAEIGNVQFANALLVHDRTAYLSAAYGTRRDMGWLLAIDF